MKNPVTRSKELFKLYEGLADAADGLEEEPAVDPRTGKSLEEIGSGVSALQERASSLGSSVEGNAAFMKSLDSEISKMTLRLQALGKDLAAGDERTAGIRKLAEKNAARLEQMRSIVA